MGGGRDIFLFPGGGGPLQNAADGLPWTSVGEPAKRGHATRRARGIYVHPDADLPAHFSFAIACSKAPEGVICLLSALRFHEIGTQNPSDVWIAIDRSARRPEIDYPTLRVVRFSGLALTSGVEETEGPFSIRVYSPAKTVADCFKYRHKIGLDVVIEALKEGWRERRFTLDELGRCARVCRVENVMTPFLEAIV